MKNQPNIYIVGLGAIGGGYASMAKDLKNFEVKVIVNEERKNRYSENGFLINGKKYDFDYITEPEEEVNLIIFAVKATQLENAIEQARSFISENTIILSLLNGISSERLIYEKIGKGKILPAFTVGSDGQRTGNRINFSLDGKVVFGHSSPALKTFAEKAAEILNNAGILFEKVDNIAYRQWWKMTANVGGNQIQGLLDVNYGAFKNENVADISRAAMRECIAIARKLEVPLGDEIMEEILAFFGSLEPENITSMMQDLKAGRKTEVDIFAGEICRLGKKLKIDTPVNKLLLDAIRFKESKN